MGQIISLIWLMTMTMRATIGSRPNTTTPVTHRHGREVGVNGEKRAGTNAKHPNATSRTKRNDVKKRNQIEHELVALARPMMNSSWTEKNCKQH